MSPSDVIRKKLDERGIDYQMHDGGNRVCFYFDYCEQCGDFLKGIDVIGACVIASQSYLTPEQAIAATVGVGTCHKKWRNGYGFCSECGHNITGEWAIYCPNCGRKVVNE